MTPDCYKFTLAIDSGHVVSHVVPAAAAGVLGSRLVLAVRQGGLRSRTVDVGHGEGLVAVVAEHAPRGEAPGAA